jgi:hypothetical protein
VFFKNDSLLKEYHGAPGDARSGELPIDLDNKWSTKNRDIAP